MPLPRSLRLVVLLTGTLAIRLAAQDDPLTAGIRAEADNDLATARHDFALVLKRDPASYPGNWRLALVLVDIAKQIPDRIKSPARDSMYAEAENYARRAVAAAPDSAEGHFVLANAIGRASLSRSPRERIRRATEVRAEALRTLQIDPRHDGAWHILGRWNAEVERLSPLERLFAKAFLGGAVLGTASWDAAEYDMRQAVRFAPTRIVHRFDLAEILAARHKWSDAAAELDTLAALPVADVSDTSYQRQARALRDSVTQRLHR